MSTTDDMDHPNVRYAVSAAIGYAACQMDPDTTDDDLAAIQGAWPSNISLEAMLIAKETVIALATFHGIDVAELYFDASIASPDTP